MKALDIVFKIFAIILCIVLVPVIISTSTVWTVTGVVQPKTITKLVENVDIAETITSNEELSAELEKMNVSPEAVEEIVKSDTVTQVIDTYIEDVNAFLEGKEATNFTPDKVKEILNSNIDEITDIVEEVTEEEINKEELKAQLNTFIDEEMPAVIEEMPKPAEALKDVVPTEAREYFNVINNGTIFKVCLIATVILMAIIFALRIMKLSGFLFIGISGIVATVFMAALYFGFDIILELVLAESPEAAGILNAVTGVFTSRLLTVVIALLVISAILMAAHFVISFFRKKKTI
ncbi:MAG: hypothetical protein IKM06_05205 [Clostridia bacterium]|nr:hypothetical protein [Clostridia bacterium]